MRILLLERDTRGQLRTLQEELMQLEWQIHALERKQLQAKVLKRAGSCILSHAILLSFVNILCSLLMETRGYGCVQNASSCSICTFMFKLSVFDQIQRNQVKTGWKREGELPCAMGL